MATSMPSVSPGNTQSSSLSSWVGPYVTDMLGQAQAISRQPYQVYQGPMTADTAPLQNQAFQGIGSLAVPDAVTQSTQNTGEIASSGYTPGTFTSSNFGMDQAQQYMNPYLQSVLSPQLAEIQRQMQIAQVQNAGKATQGGAYGGGRHGLMDAELQRNMLRQTSETTGKGYYDAYTNAQGQFNTDQGRSLETQKLNEDARRYGADFGIRANQAWGQMGQAEQQAETARLMAQLSAGTQQRGIEQEGVTADYNEFLAQRDYPKLQTQYLQSMLQGLPISTYSTTPQPMSTAGAIQGAIGSAGSMYDALVKMGIIDPKAKP